MTLSMRRFALVLIAAAVAAHGTASGIPHLHAAPDGDGPRLAVGSTAEPEPSCLACSVTRAAAGPAPGLPAVGVHESRSEAPAEEQLLVLPARAAAFASRAPPSS